MLGAFCIDLKDNRLANHQKKKQTGIIN